MGPGDGRESLKCKLRCVLPLKCSLSTCYIESSSSNTMQPKSNIIASNGYDDCRKDLDAFFVPDNRDDDTAETIISPCGKYCLEICEYSTGQNTWNYSRGIVTSTHDGLLIADIKRNYGIFWYGWVQHSNGNDYLLCGEDYQGYSVINLSTATSTVYFPDTGFEGTGFCWAAVYSSPDSQMLAVDGCYWACPYELVFYDLRNPEQLPLPEIARFDNLAECQGWIANDTFAFSRHIQLRKSDGVPYNSLTAEEQAILDQDHSLSDFSKVAVEYKRPPFITDA